MDVTLVYRKGTPALNSPVSICTTGWWEALWELTCPRKQLTVSPARGSALTMRRRLYINSDRGQARNNWISMGMVWQAYCWITWRTESRSIPGNSACSVRHSRRLCRHDRLPQQIHVCFSVSACWACYAIPSAAHHNAGLRKKHINTSLFFIQEKII